MESKRLFLAPTRMLLTNELPFQFFIAISINQIQQIATSVHLVYVERLHFNAFASNNIYFSLLFLSVGFSCTRALSLSLSHTLCLLLSFAHLRDVSVFLPFNHSKPIQFHKIEFQDYSLF